MAKLNPSKKKATKVGKRSGDGQAGDRTEASGYFPLDRLMLDGGNPRLGANAGRLASQVEILDAVVNIFGVDDVLSSLAVNGYFEAEPLVGVEMSDSEKIRIAEGNRRLAACLILIGDDRARHHEKRTAQYQALQAKHKRSPITRVPVRILEDDRNLLSYLGVRHIAASQDWDSYAKAAWISKVMEGSDLTLADVTEMIGDRHSTVARALEGFYLVNQLIDRAAFTPSDSMRPGRGSNPDYPFSWVYTSLGYGPIRRWLELNDLSAEDPSRDPLNTPNNIEDAGELLTFMFGNKTKSRMPAISDSRQISDLAKAISDPESRRMLKRGRSVEEVKELLRPPKERVVDGLYDAQDALQSVLTPLSQGEVSSSDSFDLIEPSKKVRSLAVDVNKKIMELYTGDDE